MKAVVADVDAGQGERRTWFEREKEAAGSKKNAEGAAMDERRKRDGGHPRDRRDRKGGRNKNPGRARA